MPRTEFAQDVDDMPNDSVINSIAEKLLKEFGLDEAGWTFGIVDSLDGRFGYTDDSKKTIEISREHFPTFNRNVEELIRHEVAHAICGHGLHNLEWWDTLMDIGGRGVWVNEWGTVEQARITDEKELV